MAKSDHWSIDYSSFKLKHFIFQTGPLVKVSNPYAPWDWNIYPHWPQISAKCRYTLECPLTWDYSSRQYIFQPSFSGGFVSFQGCKYSSPMEHLRNFLRTFNLSTSQKQKGNPFNKQEWKVVKVVRVLERSPTKTYIWVYNLAKLSYFTKLDFPEIRGVLWNKGISLTKPPCEVAIIWPDIMYKCGFVLKLIPTNPLFFCNTVAWKQGDLGIFWNRTQACISWFVYIYINTFI